MSEKQALVKRKTESSNAERRQRSDGAELILLFHLKIVSKPAAPAKKYPGQ